MKCPYCEKELPGGECPDCGEYVPENAHYCMACGASQLKHDEEGPGDEVGFDPDERVLCPDGTCTGIIIDGKCSECGMRPEDYRGDVQDETAR